MPPRGALPIARIGDEVAGCIGLRPISHGVGKMKRLYVRPAFRKFGIGQQLVQAVIDAARRTGHRERRLHTLASMTSPQALYRRLGCTEIPSNDTAHLPGTRFYSFDLAD